MRRRVDAAATGEVAAQQGYRVKYVLAAKLANELVEAADDRQLSKPLPATAELSFCAWTSSATWSSTGVGPSCCSRC
jgi:hypothetical protein